jgi:hypothetical protein
MLKFLNIFLLALTLFSTVSSEMSNFEKLQLDFGSCFIASGLGITGYTLANGTEFQSDPINVTMGVNVFDRLFYLDFGEYGFRTANESHAFLYSPSLNQCTQVPTNYTEYVSDMSRLLHRGLKTSVTNNFQDSSSYVADVYDIYFALTKSKFDCNMPTSISVGQSALAPNGAGGYNVYYYSERLASDGITTIFEEARFTSIQLMYFDQSFLPTSSQCEIGNVTPYSSFCSNF